MAASATRSPRRGVDGVLLVDKPRGLSSNSVLQRVKRAYRAEKAGHTGTLDPLADGLLPICFGEATKFSMGLLDADKSYQATLLLGITTETGDAEGAVLRERPVDVDSELIEQAIARFRGDIMQVPHRYSALKRDGRALYDYARAGDPVTIQARPVRINRLDVVRWEPPSLTVVVNCSKGTYVRSLAEDIGEQLHCGAHVIALRRTAVGPYGVEDAIALVALESCSETERDAALLPMTTLVSGLRTVALDGKAAARFRQGQRIAVDEGDWTAGIPVAVYGPPASEFGSQGEFLGIAQPALVLERWHLLPSRLVASDPCQK